MADTDAIIAPKNVANTPSVASATTALAANPARGAWGIQNVGATNVLYVRMGPGASDTVFHKVLKGGTGAKDGLGASWDFDGGGAIYTGEITVAGTSPSYVVWEL